MRKVDRRAQDRVVFRVVVARDERLVDFQLVDGQALQLRERRMSRAEIVDGQAEPELVNAVHDRERLLHVVHDRALGHLECQRVRRELMFLRQLEQEVG